MQLVDPPPPGTNIMLGNLFLLTVFVVILAFVISAVGDDFSNLWRWLTSHRDPEVDRLRRSYQQTRRH
jgi:hypothetical protein